MTQRSPLVRLCPKGFLWALARKTNRQGGRVQGLAGVARGHVTVGAHKSGMSFARFRRSGIFTQVGIRMTDRRFYLLLALLILALAGGEIVYAMVGPLSEPTGQLDEQHQRLR
jgi:hypothetical protein